MPEISTHSRNSHLKLANVLFAKELGRRHPSIKSIAVHPGRVKTNLMGMMFDDGGFGAVLLKCLDPMIARGVEEGANVQL